MGMETKVAHYPLEKITLDATAIKPVPSNGMRIAYSRNANATHCTYAALTNGAKRTTSLKNQPPT